MEQKEKIDRCNNCFWNSASLETWPTFESRFGENTEQRIQLIKVKKCKECKEEKDNYSEIWRCESCGKQIDGHQKLWHGNLCEDCFSPK